jgi:hypothetical protein
VVSVQRLVPLAAVALVAQGCGDSLESPSKPGYVSRDGLGKAWPLTVDAGVLNCLEYGDVTFTANGTLYAVTALARLATTLTRSWRMRLVGERRSYAHWSYAAGICAQD